MSAGEQAPLTPETAPKGPAIDILKYIADLEIPEMNSLEDLQGFLIENQVTEALCTAIENHGDLRSRYAVQPAIYDESPSQLFSAAVFPRALEDGRTEASLLHIYQFNNQLEKPVLGIRIPVNGDYSLDESRPLGMTSVGSEPYPRLRGRFPLQGSLDRMKQHFAYLDDEQPPEVAVELLQYAAAKMASVLEDSLGSEEMEEAEEMAA